MAEKGIIFSGPMVRALLDGRKTQTRRLLTAAPDTFEVEGAECEVGLFHEIGKRSRVITGRCITLQTVPYAPGDRLYVREAFCGHWGINLPEGVTYIRQGMVRQQNGSFVDLATCDVPCGVWYRADRDEKPLPHSRWTPSIHMPRWASRIWLSVSEVRVQRLQEISEADSFAEGVELPKRDGQVTMTAKDSYKRLWDSLHTEPGTRWEDNPWIVAVTFEVNHGNIDAEARHAG